MPHKTQGIYYLSQLKSFSNIFSPLLLFRVDKKNPTNVCFLRFPTRTRLGSQASQEENMVDFQVDTNWQWRTHMSYIESACENSNNTRVLNGNERIDGNCA